MKHKKVELTELFYDLVFVYGISKETALIHHTHHGTIPWESFLAFSIGMIVMINSWMVQTVFTNRFGKNSLTNIGFMLGQMALLLISLSSVTGEFNRQNFLYFYSAFTGISLLLLAQYAIEYVKSQNSSDRRLIKRFLEIMFLRSAGIFIALFFSYQIGLIIAIVSVLVTWILPGLRTNPLSLGDQEKLSPINVPHLLERLSLLVIIIFGEMLIGIADYFSADRLGINSVLIFLIVAVLFMTYILESEHLIDPATGAYAVNRLIYWHYPIFFGLSFITVSLSNLGGAEVNPGFITSLLYLGLFLFVAGLIGIQAFNKPAFRFSNGLILSLKLSVLVAASFSIFLAEQTSLVIALILAASLVIFGLLLRLQIKGKAAGEADLLD